jgi:cation diffusion facilitator family transporter
VEIYCEDSQSQISNDPLLKRNESKTFRVVLLTSTMMVVEILAGFFTGSMALLADGWHMASHATALGIALIAYRLARRPGLNRKFTFGAGKLIPLGGYTSAVVLAMIAFLMAFESIQRLLHPISVQFNQAIGVACAGLAVNVMSALLLSEDHSHEDEEDHGHSHGHVHDLNLRSAFIHVVADAFTSVLAITALVSGKLLNQPRLDAAMGIIGSGVILSWAYQLVRQTGWELLDGHSKRVDLEKLRSTIERDGTRLVDLHVWRIAPKAVACELVLTTSNPKGSKHYRDLLKKEFQIQHTIIEEISNA